ncbi:hypothetical protein [Brunnivagina elsteri]|uniref:Uncharacterized protein n=1 Tax=Brunnivagina elsteri CCALA 953 TaxID=987040 RepID=A0A2A2TP70_9CYAN|nr:hypothetical protein [Calothrix elsteri]PAX60207.1 hypothetical protein CK510_03005 [Calothrix elsteri CCALA 953]
MDDNLNFQSGQILFLECDTSLESRSCGNIKDIRDRSRLYAELIQVVVSRQLCWVRPLLLVDFTQEIPLVNDLRGANDILWSVDSFRPALDTDTIEFLSQVIFKEPKPELLGVAKQQLNQFIQQLWQYSQNKIR